MRVLIVALFCVWAFVNGHEDMPEEIERSPCYPIIKKFHEFQEGCEDFTSSLYTDEQLNRAMIKTYKKIRENHPDKVQDFKEKEGQEFGWDSSSDKYLKMQLCGLEKSGVVDAETKSIDAERYIALFDVVTDEKAKAELTVVMRDCIAKQTDGELKFISQDKCFQQEAVTACMTDKQKEM